MVLTGSAGGGKSRVAAEKLHAFMLRYPGATGLAMRKARQYASKSVVPLLRHSVIGPHPGVTFYKSDMVFEYRNGSMIYIGGMRDDEQREAIRSIGPAGALDIVWMEEANAFTENDYNEVLARMRGRAAPWTQVMLTTNPDASTHWIHTRLIVPREASVYKSTAHDNPFLPKSYFGALDKLTGVLRARLRDGLWKAAEGLVYDQFDPDIHLLDDAQLVEHGILLSDGSLNRDRVKSVVAGVDWGYTSPGVIAIYAVDGDGRMYLIHEVYQTQRLIQYWAARARELQDQYEIEIFACDPSEPGYIAEFGAAGAMAGPMKVGISERIQRVNQRLMVQPDGRARLYFRRAALEEEDPMLLASKLPASSIQEIVAYCWRTRDGRPEEKPIDRNDHAMNALEYAASYVDQFGPHVSWVIVPK